MIKEDIRSLMIINRRQLVYFFCINSGMNLRKVTIIPLMETTANKIVLPINILYIPKSSTINFLIKKMEINKFMTLDTIVPIKSHFTLCPNLLILSIFRTLFNYREKLILYIQLLRDRYVFFLSQERIFKDTILLFRFLHFLRN